MADNAQAEYKEWLARQYDRWARQAEDILRSGLSSDRLLRRVKANGDAHDIWTGPAAGSFLDELHRIGKKIEKLPGGFERTARNLRASAKDLRDTGRN